MTAEYGSDIAESFGYSEDELASAPEGSNLGLSCGNPLAMASISDGETVIDLGSGAGFDSFLAANRVGRSGKVIGVDMNKVQICWTFSAIIRVTTQFNRPQTGTD
ncbi:putative arsenite methyltransferase-like protein [Ilyonectria robusta]